MNNQHDTPMSLLTITADDECPLINVNEREASLEVKYSSCKFIQFYSVFF